MRSAAVEAEGAVSTLSDRSIGWRRLVDSSYALGLMARTTPAWREVYVRILGELIERHTGWWSASDWLTQFGPEPERGSYPSEYQLLIPPELWGDYDVLGWTANGIDPWPVQMRGDVVGQARQIGRPRLRGGARRHARLVGPGRGWSTRSADGDRRPADSTPPYPRRSSRSG